MRHALELAVAGILLASGATATELGNSSLVTDDASAASGVSNVMRAGEYDLHRLRGYDAENPITGDAPSVSGYTRLDGQSLTPNLDRLMQRYGQAPSARSSSRTVDVYQSPAPMAASEPGGDGGGGGGGGGGGRRYSGGVGDDPVPEPGTMLLMGLAGGAAAWKRHRARRSS